MTVTIDEVAKTLGEFEALAQKTGDWDGADAVEFSDDGVTWAPLWAASEDSAHPTYARARVYRKGVAHVDWQYVAWAESVPADDEWLELWMRKPVKLFGSFALRSAYRHAFRDVVGDLRGPDEQLDGPGTKKDDAPPEPRDWKIEYGCAETVVELDTIRAECRSRRENTDELNAIWRARRAELIAADWAPLAQSTGMSVADTIDAAVAYERATEHLEREERRAPRQPQDHLPGNRASRRAAQRKGRR